MYVTKKFKTYREAVAFVEGLQVANVPIHQVHSTIYDGNPFVEMNCDENGRWTHDVRYLNFRF